MTLYPLDDVAPGHLALVDDAGRTLSYGQLRECSYRVGERVLARRVALVLTHNSIGCMATIVALLQRGAVPILIDAAADDRVAGEYIDRYQPEYLVLPAGRSLVRPGYSPISREFDDVLLVRRDNLNRTPETHPDLALLLPTSGSTGSPKLVRQSRKNLRSNAESIAAFLRITPDARAVTSLPLFYAYGFSILNSHLFCGATMLATRYPVMAKQFWEFFREEGATSLAGVPLTYQMLQRLGFADMELPSLRTLTQAGGRMAEPLIREFARYARARGIDLYVMYGQTEATARMSYVPPSRAADKAGSIGIAIPGGEFFIVGENGDVIGGPRDEGELCYRGPNVAMGYAESRTDLTRGDDWSGVLRTGDVAYRDDDGFYFLTGRLSRFLKVFGKRVSLQDLEQMCCQVVGEAACGGVDDHVVVWITEADRREETHRHLAERTNIHHSAFTVVVVPALPRTASGKVDYRSLER